MFQDRKAMRKCISIARATGIKALSTLRKTTRNARENTTLRTYTATKGIQQKTTDSEQNRTQQNTHLPYGVYLRPQAVTFCLIFC